MATTTSALMTARALFDRVRPFGPAVEAGDLVFESDPPAELEPALRLLHTGVRALLTGRRWYGRDGDTGRVAELDPAAPIPAGIALLCVEGDERWDRIDPSARRDLPRLFAPDRAPGPSPAGSHRPRPGNRQGRQ